MIFAFRTKNEGIVDVHDVALSEEQTKSKTNTSSRQPSDGRDIKILVNHKNVRDKNVLSFDFLWYGKRWEEKDLGKAFFIIA